MNRLAVRLEPIVMAIVLPFALMAALLLPASLVANRRFFRIWEKRGYHITPVHFYQPIPDTRELRDELWSRRSNLVGLDMREEEQAALLAQLSSQFKDEVKSLPMARAAVPHQYCMRDGGFGGMDGAILYSMVRRFEPQKIIEIGSGNSTYLLAQALRRNQESNGPGCELTVIDPYPNDIIRAGFPGLSRLIPARVQDVPLSEFSRLGDNDILFIDSSHVLSVGSDVEYEYLEVIPRLNRGVLVHSHDIFLPAEYPRQWVIGQYMFWNEQQLLQAFLSFNQTFQVLWAGMYMTSKHSERLEAAFGSDVYRICLGGASFWMKRVR